jgi:hypothetical protein
VGWYEQKSLAQHLKTSFMGVRGVKGGEGVEGEVKKITIS